MDEDQRKKETDCQLIKDKLWSKILEGMRADEQKHNDDRTRCSEDVYQ